MRWALIIFGIVAVGGILLAVFSSPPDEELIVQSLQEMADASESGRPGGVLDHLSRSAQFNDIPMDDRGEVADVVRKMKPRVEFGAIEPVISGEQAIVTTPVTIGYGIGPVKGEQTIDDMVITLRKETGVKWFILPSPVWRVVEVDAPGFNPSVFYQGIGL